MISDLIESVQDGEILLKVKIDTLEAFMKTMSHEYHLPSYEKFLDEVEESLKYYGKDTHKSIE